MNRSQKTASIICVLWALLQQPDSSRAYNSLSLFAKVSTTNSLELQEDPYEEIITEITSKLGLRRIGWIFTDLVADDLEKGTVKHFRGNVETHFLSGQV